MFRVKERTYVTADRSRVVEEGDPEAAFLLAAEGGEIPTEEAERLGLTGKKMAGPEPMVVHSIAADPPKDEDAVAAEDDADAVEDKAVERAPANKAQSRARSEDK